MKKSYLFNLEAKGGYWEPLREREREGSVQKGLGKKKKRRKRVEEKERRKRVEEKMCMSF